jgi:hypothetical protein
MKPRVLPPQSSFIKFSAPLSAERFKELIGVLFGNKLNDYNLWGDPIDMGPTKVHVYGAERVSWISAMFEVTEKGILIVAKDSGVADRLFGEIKKAWDKDATKE